MRSLLQIAACVVCAWLNTIAFAQTAPNIVISPAAASSADTVTMRIDHGTPPFWVADSHRVSQEGNRVRVTLGRVMNVLLPGVRPPFVPGFQYTTIELGKFPAGSYTVDVFGVSTITQLETPVATGIPLVVSDARTLKTAPYVQINYADHWWNPAESGWGLFIWHDKLDRVLAAWFTYGSDNKAEWYTIQAGSWVNHKQYDGQVIKTTGPSFAAFVPGSAVQSQVVGSASINFTDANNGVFTYTLSGVTQSRNITRFKP